MVAIEYKEALDFMYNQLPMFHRIGKAAYKADLCNANALDRLCGFPHRRYKTIHVAGTNGKGSVSHMLAAVLQKAGYTTGLFTSPHLIDFRERIRVNGEMIDEHSVAAFISKFKSDFEVLKPSFFEMTSALAFQYFAQMEVDVAVIETGLGGRLDSTNIINPVLSIVTNIGFDHMDLLGDTLEKIAGEKAGIIKQGVPVVVGESHPDTKPVFESTARNKGSEIVFADEIFKASALESPDLNFQKVKVEKNHFEETYELDLKGLYQQKNLCTLLAAVETLEILGFSLKSHLKEGLKNVTGATHLMGRWQVLAQNPTVICDTGHNFDGVSWVVNQIQQLRYHKLHFVFGVVNDKDVANILTLLPSGAEYYFTRASIPRAMDENELKLRATAIGLKGESYSTVESAIKNAKKNAAPNDLIFIGGSTFIVADALVLERKK